MGVLFLVCGACFVAGVVNPPRLRTWGAPASLTAFGVAIFRTRALPRWTAAMFLAAALLLLARYAAFRGALPFPQFLAFIVLGVILLARIWRTSKPIANRARPIRLPASRWWRA
jgi:hypothetical protein